MKTKWNGKKLNVKKSDYMALIYDGHSVIERVVWVDDTGSRYVTINGFLFNADLELNNFSVKIWYRG